MKYSLIPFLSLSLAILSCENTADKSQPSLMDLSSPAGENSSLPYLVKGSNDTLYLSWVEKMEDTVILKYACLTSGEWSVREEIARGNDWFVNWADYPMIGISQSGAMTGHYLAKSSAGTYSYDVNLLVKKHGRASWTGPVVPHTDATPTEHGFVTMLPLSKDRFQVAWLDGRNTGGEGHGGHSGAMTIRTAIMDTDGLLTEEAELDARVCDCCQTTGAVTDIGPVFVYRNRSEMEIRDLSIVRKVNGQWTAPKTICEDNWNIAGCPVNGPRMDAIGNSLAVAWFSAPNNQPQVKVIFSRDGGASFSKPVIADHKTPLGRTDVVMLDENKAMVSWLAKENDKTYIKARVVYASGDTEPPVTISETNEARKSGFPQMELLGRTVYFAWTHGDESPSIKLASLEVK